MQAQALGASPLWSTEAQLSANLLELGDEPTTVYNLEVSEFHSYFVGHSHVLVHNGDPDSAACPTTPPPVATTPPRTTRRPDVTCGESGSYRDDLGGGSVWKSWVDARTSSDFQRDHVPSGGALKARTDRLLNELADRIARGKCRALNKSETKAVEDALKAARKAAATETTDLGFTIAEPNDLHADSRTFQNKNKPLITGDAGELQRAALMDRKELEDLMTADKLRTPPKYPLTPECEQKIRDALKVATSKTQEDYDAELGAIASKALADAGFVEIFASTCRGATYQ